MEHVLKIGNFTFTYSVLNSADEDVDLDMTSAMFSGVELTTDEMKAIDEDAMYDLAVAEIVKEFGHKLNKAA